MSVGPACLIYRGLLMLSGDGHDTATGPSQPSAHFCQGQTAWLRLEQCPGTTGNLCFLPTQTFFSSHLLRISVCLTLWKPVHRPCSLSQHGSTSKCAATSAHLGSFPPSVRVGLVWGMSTGGLRLCGSPCGSTVVHVAGALKQAILKNHTVMSMKTA